MLRRILVLSFMIAFTTSLKAESADWLHLQGDKDTVKLLWEPREWPPEQIGFNVKRRAPGGEWQVLSIRPIVPTLYPEDMDTRTHDPVLREELKQRQQYIVKYAPEMVIPLDDQVKQFAERKRLDDRIQGALIDYNQALVYGFAYQDMKVPKGEIYEYALFSALRGGKESAEPVAVRSWKWGSVPNLTLRFGQPKLGRLHALYMSAVWPVPPEDLRPNLVRFLRVYCVAPDGTKTVFKDRYA